MISKLILKPQFRNNVRLFSGKDVKHGIVARNSVLEGCKKVQRCVSVTLGPLGRNVVIDLAPVPIITKDGVTVATHIQLSDPQEQLGAEFLINSSKKTNEFAGDGTTTTVILAQHMFREAIKSIQAGFNPMGLLRGMEYAKDNMIKALETFKKPIQPQYLKSIIKVSCNHDQKLATLIQDSFEGIENSESIQIEMTRDANSKLEEKKGQIQARGYFSEGFCNDEKGIFSKSKCKLLICSFPIVNFGQIQYFIEKLNSDEIKNGLIIVCSSIEADVLEIVLKNVRSNKIELCISEAPGNAEFRHKIMEDMGILFSCRIQDMNDIKTVQMDDVNQKKQLGDLERVKVESEQTIIVASKPNQFLVDVRIKSIKKELDRQKNTNFQNVINSLNERISLLNNKVRVIMIGGQSLVEIRESFDRAVDAVSSARVAKDHGVLPGGGVSLVQAAIDAYQQFNNLYTHHIDSKSDSQINKSIKPKNNQQMSQQFDDLNLDGNAEVTDVDVKPLNYFEIQEKEIDLDWEDSDQLSRMINEGEQDDIRQGYQIVLNACKQPHKVLLQNANITDSNAYGTMVELQKQDRNSSITFDVVKESIVDAQEVGLLDSEAVVRKSLENAISISSMMLTTENVIVELPRVDGNDQRKAGDHYDSKWKTDKQGQPGIQYDTSNFK